MNFNKKFIQWRSNISLFFNNILETTVDFLISWPARLLLILILIAYWSCAAHGFAQLQIGMSSEKLFLADSPLLALVYLQRQIIFKEGGQVIRFL